MTDWRDDARTELQLLHRLLTSPTKVSEIPQYVVESLSANLPQVIDSETSSSDVHAIVRAAFYAIGDAGYMDENDPILKQLWKLTSTLPAEE
jgi:hypothetical protein